MLQFPTIDPVAFRLGSVEIYWYGISYLLAFIVALYLLNLRRLKQDPPWQKADINDLMFYMALGVILGGRIGYVLFYQPVMILETPWTLLTFWVSGRSFHGGLLGVIIAVGIYALFKKRHLLEITDFIAPIAPIGIAFGRLGNFMNGELWGRITTVPWGMVFPHVDLNPRHPSQLYACVLEGLLLFGLLWHYSKKPRLKGQISALFLVGYGVFRFISEWFREPDIDKGFIAFDWLTMGQLLSVPMIVLGLLVWWGVTKKYGVKRVYRK